MFSRCILFHLHTFQERRNSPNFQKLKDPYPRKQEQKGVLLHIVANRITSFHNNFLSESAIIV